MKQDKKRTFKTLLIIEVLVLLFCITWGCFPKFDEFDHHLYCFLLGSVSILTMIITGFIIAEERF